MVEGLLASSRGARRLAEQCARLQEVAMLISDVLRTKGHNVVRIHTADSVEFAVRKLAEHRIGALVVEDRWMKPVGIFSDVTSSTRWPETAPRYSALMSNA